MDKPLKPSVARPAIDGASIAQGIRANLPPEAPQIERPEPPAIAKDETVALLVAGVNYPRIAQGNTIDPKRDRTFFRMSGRYKDHLLAHGVVTQVLVFDFFTGEIRSHRKGGSAPGKAVGLPREKLVPDNYRYRVDDKLTLKKPPDNAPRWQRIRFYFPGVHNLAKARHGNEQADVEQKDYEQSQGGSLVREGSLSIRDVYASIQAAPPGAVREVHFFGHAVFDGPVIVNTLAYPGKAYDKDARVKDFQNPELQPIFGPSFRQAFSPDALLMIWGCDHDTAFDQTITAAETKLKRRQSIDVEIKTLRKYIAGTYASALARAAGRTVYAALPGPYAVMEGESNDDKPENNRLFNPKLMHVNLQNCGHMLALYKKHLGIQFPLTGIHRGHPEYGRGYAPYAP